MFFLNPYYKKNLMFTVVLFIFFVVISVFSFKMFFGNFFENDIDTEFVLYERYVESYIDRIKNDVVLASNSLNISDFMDNKSDENVNKLFDFYLNRENAPEEIYLFDNENKCVFSVGNYEKSQEALEFIADKSVLNEVYVSNFFVDKYTNENHIFFGKTIIAENQEIKLLFCYNIENFKHFFMDNNKERIFSVLIPNLDTFIVCDDSESENEIFSNLDFMEFSKILKLKTSNENFMEGERQKLSLSGTKGDILINYKKIFSPEIVLISVEKDTHILFYLILYTICLFTLFAVMMLMLYLKSSYNLFLKLKNFKKEVDIVDVTFDDISFSKTGIEIIDLCLDKISNLCGGYKKILFDVKDMAAVFNTNIGIIEILNKEGYVIYSSEFSDIVGAKEDNSINEINKISIEEFFKFKNSQWTDFKEEDNIYCVEMGNTKRWIKVFYYDKNETKCIVIDVSGYVIKKYKNVFNSDFDYITGLLEKDAFIERVTDFINNNNIGFGCLTSIELSYCSTIYDTYGEYVLYEYLKTAVSYFSPFFDGCFVGVKNKGEFMTFIYSENSKDDIKEKLTEWQNKTSQNVFTAPDGKKFRIKFIIGYACYPEDSTDLDILLKYSVFALFETKKLYKKSVHSFSLENYNRDIFLETRTKALDKLIDENNAVYHFQPIVNVLDCSVYGYEVLLRMESNIFSSPIEIVNLALKEGRSYLFEKMNILNAMEIIKKNKTIFDNKRLFINSIASSSLTEDDLHTIRSNYSDVKHRMVYEISTMFDDNSTVINKGEIFNKINVNFAIDKFGGKYTDDYSLLSGCPEFVKIDRSLISDIHLKKEKQSHVMKIVKYANENNINVIAVGIETYDELAMVIKLGIKLVQGYYISHPNSNFADEIRESLRNEILEIRRN